MGSCDLDEKRITVVILEDVTKIYETPRGPIRALDSVDLHVKEGEFLTVRGPSGSGKSTLLMVIAAMLRVSSGEIRINGIQLNRMTGREVEEFRARTIGFVFQMFHLIPYLSVLENVLLADRAAHVGAMTEKAENILAGLQMQDRIHHRPAELSTGERQRVAIARALLNDPILFLADEPTGNLDAENAGAVLSCLSDLNQKGCTVILATHEAGAEQFAHRVVALEKGRLVLRQPSG
jgi:ABC-type lipoprotein export system ATPase subunit